MQQVAWLVEVALARLRVDVLNQLSYHSRADYRIGGDRVVVGMYRF